MKTARENYQKVRVLVNHQAGIMRFVVRNAPAPGVWVVILRGRIGVFFPGPSQKGVVTYPGLDGLYCNERKLRDDAADLLYDSLHDLTGFSNSPMKPRALLFGWQDVIERTDRLPYQRIEGNDGSTGFSKMGSVFV